MSKATANDILTIARSWLGYNETNKRYLEILNVYNSHQPLARGYAIKPTDEWCDAFVSAVAIKAGAVDIIGTEVGCEKHISIFKSKGIWIEDGSISPLPGDVILFNWDDATQSNDGGADHIGYVEEVKNGVITCIEGNMRQAVGRRQIPVGWGYIRGFARPRYAKSDHTVTKLKTVDEIAQEVLDNKWGSGEARKARLVAAGYDYGAVQIRVNQILSTKKPVLKPAKDVAKEVIAGKWGNGADRRARLINAGYDPNEIQKHVNAMV